MRTAVTWVLAAWAAVGYGGGRAGAVPDHAVVAGPDAVRVVQAFFEGDPLIPARDRDQPARLGRFSPVLRLTRDADGVWQGQRDIRLDPPRANAAATDGALVERLKAQADAWDKAIVRKDRAAIEGNMADDFRQIDRAGNVETKTSFVDGLLSPDLQIDPYTVEDFEVRLYGDTALLSGRTRMSGRYQGRPFQSHYRYIDVYVRQGEAWKIVSVQISPIPETTSSR